MNEPGIRAINWNFRIGIKTHSNELVPDVAIVSILRNHTNWQKIDFSLLQNSIFNYQAYFPIGKERQHSPLTTRQLLTFGKKFPCRFFGRKIAFRIGGGVLMEWLKLYDRHTHTFETKYTMQTFWLIQPNVEF